MSLGFHQAYCKPCQKSRAWRMLRATSLGMTERELAFPSAGAIAPGVPVQVSAVRYRSIRFSLNAMGEEFVSAGLPAMQRRKAAATFPERLRSGRGPQASCAIRPRARPEAGAR